MYLEEDMDGQGSREEQGGAVRSREEQGGAGRSREEQGRRGSPLWPYQATDSMMKRGARARQVNSSSQSYSRLGDFYGTIFKVFT